VHRQEATFGESLPPSIDVAEDGFDVVCAVDIHKPRRLTNPFSSDIDAPLSHHVDAWANTCALEVLQQRAVGARSPAPARIVEWVDRDDANV
jgi:hypothetical protein